MDREGWARRLQEPEWAHWAAYRSAADGLYAGTRTAWALNILAAVAERLGCPGRPAALPPDPAALRAAFDAEVGPRYHHKPHLRTTAVRMARRMLAADAACAPLLAHLPRRQPFRNPGAGTRSASASSCANPPRAARATAACASARWSAPARRPDVVPAPRGPDCIIAHGATALLQERLLYKSDAYRLLLCRLCGRATLHDGRACAACKTADGATAVTVPYSFKLLLQEMTAVGIDWQLRL